MTAPGIGALPSFAVAALTHASAPAFEPSRVILPAGSSQAVRPPGDQPRHPPHHSSQTEPDVPTSSDAGDEMVDLLVQRRTYTANLKALKAQSEMLGLLIDTLA
ncbi:MAG: hypothetical protein HUU25_02200 [Candidatus Sumerlaeia bacterium]|nr:hypothetical protein [Candidatus Sumerlaeia bacterium]